MGTPTFVEGLIGSGLLLHTAKIEYFFPNLGYEIALCHNGRYDAMALAAQRAYLVSTPAGHNPMHNGPIGRIVQVGVGI